VVEKKRPHARFSRVRGVANRIAKASPQREGQVGVIFFCVRVTGTLNAQGVYFEELGIRS
jgi:hypothetical protein